MSDISRSWWIGYCCAFAAQLAAIGAAWWLFLPVPEKPAPPPPPPPAAAELPALTVDGALARLRIAREAIRSYRMRVVWEHRDFDGSTPLDAPDPGGQVITAASGVWIEKGDWYRVEAHFDVAQVGFPEGMLERIDQDSPDSDAVARSVHPEAATDRTETYALPNGGSVEFDIRSVVDDKWYVFNGRHRAWWSSRYGSIYLDAVEHIPNLPDLRIGDLNPEPLQWGFDVRRDAIEEVIAHNRDHAWTVRAEDAEDGPRYVIRGEPDPDGLNPNARMEFHLDPLRDYLIRHAVFSNGDAQYKVVTITLQQAADGRWYPETVVERDNLGMLTIGLSGAEFNTPIGDELFHWENMPFNASTVKLHKKTGEMTSTTMRYRNGYWTANL